MQKCITQRNATHSCPRTEVAQVPRWEEKSVLSQEVQKDKTQTIIPSFIENSQYSCITTDTC